MIWLPCTINFTFICVVEVIYSTMGYMVLNQCSWRSINRALSKFRYSLISMSLYFPCPFKECFKKWLCWFVYQVLTYLVSFNTFIHFAALVYRLTVTFFISLKENKYLNTCLKFCFWSAKICVIQVKHYWLEFCPQKYISSSIPVS